MNKISELIKNCEPNGDAVPYFSGKAEINSASSEIFIISDLHIAAGKRRDGNYDGTENFFADASFQRFILHITNNFNNSTLIINGDFIDFMRVVCIPETEEDYTQWSKALLDIGIPNNIQDLQPLVLYHEKKYGFRTNEIKSVWKLLKVIQGHSEIFDALSLFLLKGNSLIITKGNHDLEWMWLGVRNYLRYTLMEKISEITGEKSDEEKINILKDNIFRKIRFVDDIAVINKDLYVEHGQRYDRYTNIVGDPFLKNNTELNIPFGSFFNRYLLNLIELHYPFFDNVRPREDLLPMLFKKNFFLGLKVLFRQIPFMLKMIPKKYYAYMFRDFLIFLLSVCIPVLISIGVVIYPYISNINFESEPAGLWGTLKEQGFNLVKLFAGSYSSYLLTRIVSYFKLKEPDYLDEDAIKILDEFDYKIVTMGHTHNPQQVLRNGKWYFNTGTWIPIVEASSAEVRNDKTYTFLFIRFNNNEVEKANLMRWNDDADRMDYLILFAK